MNAGHSEKYRQNGEYGKQEDYHHNINPDCNLCHKPVFWSRHILSADRVWHIHCFRCSSCNKLLKPGQQSIHGSKLLCTKPCYNELFVGHSFPSAIQSLPKTDDNEHNCNWVNSGQEDNCMRCSICERIVGSGESRVHDRFPYCKFAGYKLCQQERSQQSHKKQPCVNSLCIRCLKPVFAAEYCYSISYPWHIHCLRCASCDRSLQPGAHAVHEGLPLCTFPCYNRIFAVDGFRRGIRECRP